jgi:hypothetical protein
MRHIAVLVFAQMAPLISASTENPVEKVVKLLEDLKAKIEADEETEQKTYDKFACWCEETLLEKSKAIDDGTAAIQKLTQEILAMTGKIQELGVTSMQLDKEVVDGKDGMEEAKEIREKEKEAYIEDRKQAEQCIGALEAAIKVLTGAGTKTEEGGEELLSTFQQAQILSAVAGLHDVIKKVPSSYKLSKNDLNTVQSFVADPSRFVHGFTGAQVHSKMSLTFSLDDAAERNPFGDYAPASGQIQGILKGLYDSFTSNLEKANAEEATKQKQYKNIMKTKEAEQEALEASLAMQSMEKADLTKKLADDKALLKDTKEQLKADKKFFAETKQACKDNAVQWSQRSRVRTEELQGMAKALEILTSDEAKATFEAAHSNEKSEKAEALVQIQHQVISKKPVQERINAYERIRAAVKTSGSLRLAQIGATIMSGGHFDKVISMIDKMIRDLRWEAEKDQKKKEQCEVDQTQLKYDIEDLGTDLEKLDELLERQDSEKKDLEKAIEDKQKEIEDTNTTINELIEDREQEHDDFEKAMKDDVDAVNLLQQAIEALTAVYVNNKIPLNLIQAAPKPEAFSSGGYGGRKGESGGVIAILTMIKEDLEKEVTHGKEDEEAAQMEFQKQFSDLKDLKEKQIMAKTELKNKLANLLADIAIAEKKKGRKSDLKENKEEELSAVDVPCNWVLDTFETRKEKRTAELDGLIEAKAMLMGATPAADLVVKKQQVVKRKALFHLPFPEAAPPIPTAVQSLFLQQKQQ